MKNVWKEYEIWMVHKIQSYRRGYSKLMETLHDIDFEYDIPMDENRSTDGFVLWNEFIKERRINENDRERGCSVLEMLVGLSIRIDGDYLGNIFDPRPDLIFWEMLTNLGLDKFDDRNFDKTSIHRIIKRWLHRTFWPNGLGSPFPLEHPLCDQRTVEIWDQMNAYLSENYRG